MEIFIIIVVIITIAVITISIKAKKHFAKKRQEVQDLINDTPDFTATYTYIDDTGYSGISIDEAESKILLLSRSEPELELKHRTIENRDIFSSELFEDGDTVHKTSRSSQAAGAVVGGILLGGVGAVIGGLSGKTIAKGKVKRIELRLIVNDSDNPIHDICFLNREVSRDEVLYKGSSDMARQWQARLDVLINRADKEDLINENKSFDSISNEIRKLADLKSDGIINDKEFSEQRDKLLQL